MIWYLFGDGGLEPDVEDPAAGGGMAGGFDFDLAVGDVGRKSNGVSDVDVLGKNRTAGPALSRELADILLKVEQDGAVVPDLDRSGGPGRHCLAQLARHPDPDWLALGRGPDEAHFLDDQGIAAAIDAGEGPAVLSGGCEQGKREKSGYHAYAAAVPPCFIARGVVYSRRFIISRAMSP